MQLRLFRPTEPPIGRAATDRRPPLLLLHGIGTTHDDFDTLTRALAAEFLVLAPDLPGHGRSPMLPVKFTVAAGTADESGPTRRGHGQVIIESNRATPPHPRARHTVRRRTRWPACLVAVRAQRTRVVVIAQCDLASAPTRTSAEHPGSDRAP